jgi:hypothetical protein
VRISVRKSRISARVYPRKDVLRLAVTLFALVAFAFQGFVTQTHIHTGLVPGVSDFEHSSPAKIASGSQKPHSGVPANQDPANCPICQQVAHAGQFVTPAAVSALAPTTIVSTIAIVLDAAIVATPASHPWHSRAPPQH